MTTWVTFTPSMLWIFAGAPFVEQLRGNRRLSGALSAITAAVVGVILNLTVWFALHVLFGQVTEKHAGPLRWFAFAGVPFAAMALAFVLTSQNRLSRFDVWLGRDTNEFGAARQPIHGRYALADGGWFGLGLGASREKWGLLSEPHNDFIFAIIGEELGFVGAAGLLCLFGLFAYMLSQPKDEFVESTMIGNSCSARMLAVTSKPSMSGSPRSKITASGVRARISRSASLPVPASLTS